MNFHRDAVVIVLVGLGLASACSEPGPVTQRSPSPRAGTWSGTVVQTIATGTSRETVLALEFDDSGRLIRIGEEPGGSLVLRRLIEDQRCGDPDLAALLADNAATTVVCPGGATVQLRTSRFELSPDFILDVELESSPGSSTSDRERLTGHASERYTLGEDEALDVDASITVTLSTDGETGGEASASGSATSSQTIRGRLERSSEAKVPRGS